MKKKLVLPLVLATLLSGVSHLAQAQAGIMNSAQHPMQIAILHWYSANLTTSFSVAGIPSSLAFDGANIWVANAVGYGSLIKFRASDGACVGTCTVALEDQPRALAFDGANI